MESSTTDHEMMDATDEASLLEQECTELITCDAAGCTNPNPLHSCSHCRGVYYCSVECATSDLARHQQEDCRDIHEMRAQLAVIAEGLVTAVEADDDTVQRVLSNRPTCGICLEEDMLNPIVLHKCKHAFCLGCLNQWNAHESSSSLCGTTTETPLLPCKQPHSTCPLCRAPSIPVVDAMFQNALSHLRVASLSTTTPEDRDIRCAAAEAELIKVFHNNNNRHCLTDQQQVQLELIWGEIVLLQGHEDVALRIFEETADRLHVMVKRGRKVKRLSDILDGLQWNASNELYYQAILRERQELLSQGSRARPADHTVVLLRVGHVQRQQKDWQAALRTYNYIWHNYVVKESAATLPAFQHQQVLASIAEAAYHLGWYDRAIAFGEASVAMNRCRAWSHKYVSLSYLALGNIDKARQVAAKAVLYETPWDDEHRAKVRRWYHDTLGPKGNLMG